jgi:type II secretory pathway pseudopilin PulG
MAGLVILGVIAAIVLLYAADRAGRARIRARRLRSMSERLAAAAVRAEKQQAKRQAADVASAELTSVMPAINLRPPVTLPGQQAGGDTPRD